MHDDEKRKQIKHIQPPTPIKTHNNKYKNEQKHKIKNATLPKQK